MKTKLLALLPLTSFALGHPLQALAQATSPQQPITQQFGLGNWPGHGHMWGGGYDGYGWGYGGLIMLLGMIIFFVLIYLLGRQAGERRHHPHGPMHMSGRGPGAEHGWGDPAYSALRILNERFARGEIQKPEYEEKKSAILASGPH